MVRSNTCVDHIFIANNLHRDGEFDNHFKNISLPAGFTLKAACVFSTAIMGYSVRYGSPLRMRVRIRLRISLPMQNQSASLSALWASRSTWRPLLLTPTTLRRDTIWFKREMFLRDSPFRVQTRATRRSWTSLVASYLLPVSANDHE
jgi:hypothetical protein